MSNSLFCPNCGMIKNKCVCSKGEEERPSLIERPTTEEKEELQEVVEFLKNPAILQQTNCLQNQ